MAAKDYLLQVIKFYKAYYGREADVDGLAFWSSAIDRSGGSLDKILSSFSTSSEATALYGNLTNEQLVQKIYQQIFGRSAEASGLSYWKGLLDKGLVTKGQMAITILNGAQAGDLTSINNTVNSSLNKLSTSQLDQAIAKYSSTGSSSGTSGTTTSTSSGTFTTAHGITLNMDAVNSDMQQAGLTTAQKTAAVAGFSDSLVEHVAIEYMYRVTHMTDSSNDISTASTDSAGRYIFTVATRGTWTLTQNQYISVELMVNDNTDSIALDHMGNGGTVDVALIGSIASKYAALA